MIVRVGPKTYTIERRRGITYQTFCKVLALAKLEDELTNVQQLITETALAGDAVDRKVTANFERLQRRIVAAKSAIAGTK